MDEYGITVVDEDDMRRELVTEAGSFGGNVWWNPTRVYGPEDEALALERDAIVTAYRRPRYPGGVR